MGESLLQTDGLESIIQLIYRYGNSEEELSNLISLTIHELQLKIVQSTGIECLSNLCGNRNYGQFRESFAQGFQRELMSILETCSFSYIETSVLSNEKIPYVANRIDPGSLSLLFEMSNNPTEKLLSGFVYTKNTEIRIMIIISLLSFLITNKCLPLDVAFTLVLENTNQNNREEMERMIRLYSAHILNTNHNSIDRTAISTLLEWFLDLRILEPSCGSGSFLVELIRLAGIYYDNVIGLAKNLNIDKEFMHKSEFLRRFISTCVYAVDINPLAVEIARFRVILLYLVLADQIETNVNRNFALPFINIEEGDFLRTPFAFDINLIEVIEDNNNIFDVLKSITELRLKSQMFENLELIRQKQDNLLRMIFEKQKNLTNHANKTQINKEIKSLCFGTLESFSDKKSHFSIYRNFCDVIASGGFNLIIGNPPYVRQEKIVSRKGKSELSVLDYKKRLIHDIKSRYFSSFDNTNEFEINMQSDYLIYFFYGSFPLLSSKGVHCFITSNSWLDVGYGMDFQEFIVKNMDIDLILDNSKVRSFENAEINTVISIFRPQNTHESTHHTKFMVLHQDYQSFLQLSSFKEILSCLFLPVEQSKETDTFRIRSIEQKKLLKLGMVHGKYEGLKWGNFLLRAPLIFNKLLNLDSNSSDLNAKLIRLEDVFNIKGGIKSGANKFFLLEILDSIKTPKQKKPIKKVQNNLESQSDEILKVKNGYGHIFN